MQGLSKVLICELDVEGNTPGGVSCTVARATTDDIPRHPRVGPHVGVKGVLFSPDPVEAGQDGERPFVETVRLRDADNAAFRPEAGEGED